MNQRDGTERNKSIKRIAVTVFIILAVVNAVAVLFAVFYSSWLKAEPYVTPYLLSDSETVSLDEPVNAPKQGIVRRTINKIKGTGKSSGSESNPVSTSEEGGGESAPVGEEPAKMQRVKKSSSGQRDPNP